MRLGPTRNFRAALLQAGLLFILQQTRLQGADETFLIANCRDGECYQYWIPWDSLPSKVLWDPETQTFPMKLDAEAQRAARNLHLQRGETNELDLSRIHICRLGFSERVLTSRGRSASEFTNQWFVGFEFHSRSPRRFRGVVMLLDGFYAVEKPGAFPGTNVTLPRKAVAPVNVAGEQKGLGPTVGYEDETDQFQSTLSPDFLPVRVQWNPFLNPFPLNLSAEAVRAKDLLVSERSMDPQILLHEVEIDKYCPIPALTSRGEDFDKHRYHWALRFTFVSSMNPHLAMEYAANILLDGTVASTTVRPWRGYRPQSPR